MTPEAESTGPQQEVLECLAFGVCRPRKMIVKGYVSIEDRTGDALDPIGEMKLVHDQQAEALQRFQQYLAGFRGLGQPASQTKAAVVQTQTYQILLQPEEVLAAGLGFRIVSK